MAENKTWREKTLLFHAKGSDFFEMGRFRGASSRQVVGEYGVNM
jgi:hypothetical protein